MISYYLSSGNGGMADALDSGSSGSNPVRVQVPFSALNIFYKTLESIELPVFSFTQISKIGHEIYEFLISSIICNALSASSTLVQISTPNIPNPATPYAEILELDSCVMDKPQGTIKKPSQCH